MAKAKSSSSNPGPMTLKPRSAGEKAKTNPMPNGDLKSPVKPLEAFYNPAYVDAANKQ